MFVVLLLFGFGFSGCLWIWCPVDYDSDGLTSVAVVGCFRWVFTCSLLVCLWVDCLQVCCCLSVCD